MSTSVSINVFMEKWEDDPVTGDGEYLLCSLNAYTDEDRRNIKPKMAANTVD